MRRLCYAIVLKRVIIKWLEKRVKTMPRVPVLCAACCALMPCHLYAVQQKALNIPRRAQRQYAINIMPMRAHAMPCARKALHAYA